MARAVRALIWSTTNLNISYLIMEYWPIHGNALHAAPVFPCEAFSSFVASNVAEEFVQCSAIVSRRPRLWKIPTKIYLLTMKFLVKNVLYLLETCVPAHGEFF